MIYLTKEFINQMIAHSKEEFPNEACGILAGSLSRRLSRDTLSDSPPGEGEAGWVEVVEKVYVMTNIDKSPSTYFMDAKEQLKAMKEIRNLGLEMIGIYHSHVASLAYPSSHDVELALYPEVSYVIISLKDKDNPSIRSFRIIEGRITEEEVEIE